MDIFVTLITWLVLLELIGAVAYPVLLRIIGKPTIAYVFSKPIGLLFFGYFIWVASLLTLLKPTLAGTSISLLGFSLVSYLLSKHWYGALDRLPLPDRTEIKHIQLQFWGIFVLFLIIQSFHPEIFWGEKPMDFTFLNYFIRSSEIPPVDPWAAGNAMHYYYLGTFIFALLHKISSVKSSIGYTLSIATVAGLLSVSLTGVALSLRASLKSAIVVGLVVAFISNFDVFWLVFTGKNPIGFDLYWASSRSLVSPGMNEYPIWTLLFADLHAHMISLPFAAAMLGCFCLLLEDWSDRVFPWKTALLFGALCGAIMAVNTWDTISYGLFFGVAGVLIALSPLSGIELTRRFSLAGLGAIAALSAIIFSIPFHLAIGSRAEVHYGMVFPEEFNGVSNIFKVHGHWILLTLVAALFGAKGSLESLKFSLIKWLSVIVGALVPLFLGIIHVYILHVPSAPWAVLVLCSAGCLAAISLSSSCANKKRIAPILLYAGFVLLSATELYFLMDRMNTTFKFNHTVWTVLGISSLCVLISETRIFESFRLRALVPILSIFVWCFVGSVINVYVMTTFKRIDGPRPTLDGTAYLERTNPAEKRAFDWINNNILDTPVIAEAWGPSYQDYTRFSMNTGLPTVLGWEYHIQQRGTPVEEIHRRKQDLREIYQGLNLRETLQRLNRYEVELIAVGATERRAYGQDGIEKFSANPNLFPLLYETGEGDRKIQIFTTRYSRYAK